MTFLNEERFRGSGGVACPSFQWVKHPVGAGYSAVDVDQEFRDAILNDQALPLGLLVGRRHQFRSLRRKCIAAGQAATTEYPAPTAKPGFTAVIRFPMSRRGPLVTPAPQPLGA